MQLASDGLPARSVEAWAEEKLRYVRAYMDIFSTGMKNRWPRLAYIDLFAGPGRSIVEGSNKEIAGSPMLALDSTFPFTHFFLNDADGEAASALTERARLVGRSGVTVQSLDCDAAAGAAGDLLFGGSNIGRTLGVAFIDPTGFQIGFEALRTMTANRNIDLVITFMTGPLRRFLEQPALETSLDHFFGSTDWRGLIDLRASGEKITYRRLLDHYEDRLRSLGCHEVDDHIRILNSKRSTIYHLVFASKHPKGREFFRKISKRDSSGQERLPLE